MLVETLKGLTINDAGYYKSNKNGIKGDPAIDPKVAIHTSDGKKRNVTKTGNGNPQQTLLSNRTLLIVTTTIEPHIPERVMTCRGTPQELTTPTMKGVITDAARSSARSLDSWACKQDGKGKHHVMQ